MSSAVCVKRDREVTIELFMEPTTPKLFQSSIAVFYDMIRAVANAADLAARLGDLQAFFDDLIEVSYSKHNSE